MASVFSAIQKDLGSMSPIGQSKIMLCRLDKIDYERLIADVYIYDNSMKLESIPMCFPSKGNGYGSLFMPKEGSHCLVFFTTYGKVYVLSQVSVNNSQRSDELILPGENTILSLGGAYQKTDLVGNSSISSSFGNSYLALSNGVNASYSLGKIENTLASKTLEGIRISKNMDTSSDFINTGEIKLVSYSEHYQAIDIPRVYDYTEILSNGEINQTLRSTILSETTELFNKISGDNGFLTKLLELKESCYNIDKTNDEISQEITDIFSKIKNSFNLSSKGVKIIIEKGNALTKSIDNMNDLNKITSSDVEQSAQGNDICLKLSIKDAETDEVKASAFMDTDGNCVFKFKSLKIEVENYELIEG
jgi:hypothetical protein